MQNCFPLRVSLVESQKFAGSVHHLDCRRDVAEVFTAADLADHYAPRVPRLQNAPTLLQEPAMC